MGVEGGWGMGGKSLKQCIAWTGKSVLHICHHISVSGEHVEQCVMRRFLAPMLNRVVTVLWLFMCRFITNSG